jgi:hypothetical protein
MENRKFTWTETILGLLILVAVVWLAFFLFKGIFKILSFVAPILFVAALIVNYKVVLSYGKLLIQLLQKNPLMGILALLLTFFAFPIVSAILLGLAIMNKKADQLMEQERQKREGVPTDFREISSTPKNQGYDDMFNKA